MIDEYVAAAERGADLAGEIIRPYFRASLEADIKDDESPVTIADRAAELAIRAYLGKTFPAHGLLGEEFGLERPGASLRWVLDPIDGTRAFITGRPLFGTLIALLEDGEPLLGVIDQPVTGERWVGAVGRAPRFRGGFGGKIGCRPCASLADAELSATSPEMFGADLPRFQSLAAHARRVTWGGDCYAYGLLALGQCDVIAESGLKPWDWAAITPIIEGAGGCVTDWQGFPLNLDSQGEVLAVGDPRLLPQAIGLLQAAPAK